MGAPSSIVIFGVRTLFGQNFEGLEALELEQHPWQQRAQEVSLTCWWQRIEDARVDCYALFIGDMVAHLGPENDAVVDVAAADLIARCKTASEKFARSGLAQEFGPPSLWCQWLPDF